MSALLAEVEAERVPTGEEVDFSFDELFFSRTDERGIILSGNSVFQRVSCYSWDEILNKPHKLIRHDDMPKAVFWLLWDTIKKGQPIGAYVKNRAKDGRHYWVFATVTPVDGGYLSVRLKPGSDLFHTVKAAYAELRAVEMETKPKPEESAAILLSRLRELGFRDYGAFMSEAMSQEMKERDRRTKQDADSRIASFDRLVTSAKDLLDHAASIFKAYESNAHVPLNLKIQASHLGSSGAPMYVISNNYSAISQRIQENMQDFMEAGKQVARTIDEGLFLVGTSRIQREVFEFFQQDEPNDGAVRDQEMKYLEVQQQSYFEKAGQGLHAIASQMNQFQSACREMRKLTSGLEVTRVMGKIESAALDASLTSLNDLVDDLGRFQSAILSGLREIDHSNSAIQVDVEQLLNANG
ncbi:MAG: PAS domain-containing protein [Alphaproteobacteria bacterium]|nr:PAS domain-containing protein [Alphaproteobacteria bacterium]